MLQEARLYGAMPFALLAYVRSPRLTDPAAVLRDQLERRAARFLETLRRTVFADANHPYSRPFDAAGCTFADLVNLVDRDGLEPALDALRRGGVFLTHDEFKGRTPLVRFGRQIPADPSDWTNPLAAGYVTS